MKILWVKAGILFPPDTGGRRRTLGMLREIQRAGHSVHYLGLKPATLSVLPEENADSYANLKEWTPSHEPARGSARFLLALAANYLLTRRPYVLDRYRSPTWEKRIAEASIDSDLVVCDFLTPALNFGKRPSSPPAVLFQHNIESQIWKRLADSAGNPVKRFYLRDQERRMWKAEKTLSARFDGVITVSPEDSAFCRDRYHLSHVLGEVPTGVDVSAFQPPASPPQSPVIGFLGSMDWQPNIEGVHWLVRHVLPRIRRQIPDARLKIIGRNPPSSILGLTTSDPAIEVTGTVAEVQPHVHQCSLIAVPLLAGGGTRIKIYEAMAMGVPVVSTTIGAEGLPLTPGSDILIADAPEAFGSAIVSLLSDTDRAADIASRARHRMESEFSWAAAATRFIDLCGTLMRKGTQGEGLDS
jgi:glycosyltransferase involved in cell wall biosynthesis